MRGDEREGPATNGQGAQFVRAPDGPFAVVGVEAPWGTIQVAATDTAVVGLSVLAPPDRFAADVARHTGRVRTERSIRYADDAATAVAAFLAGDPGPIGALALDLGDRGDWDRAVLGAVAGVGWGEVTSYGQVARAIGRTGAARAAGGAIGRNPIGLAIPCHRVIAGDGRIGGYGGDWFGSREVLLDIKRELLALEGVRLPLSRIPG